MSGPANGAKCRGSGRTIGRLVCLLLLALLPAFHTLHAFQDNPAREVLWAGLIYASTETAPAPVPDTLAAFGEKIKGVFGYNRIKLLSEHREPLGDGKEHLFALGKRFRIAATRKGGEDGITLLNLRIFQEERLLVETEARLGRQSPLLLRGPLCTRGGQLIIVLEVE